MAATARNDWQHLASGLAGWFDEMSAGGIFMTDSDLCIRAWNRWLEMHTGRLARDMAGVHLLEAYPDLVERGLDQYFREALDGEARIVAQRFHGYLLPIRGRSDPDGHTPGGLMPQSARIAPLRTGGSIVGTITIVENVSERVTSERELRNQIAALDRARATAEAAVRAKDEFLATLSHELRTPLNAILGWTRLMRSGKVDGAMMIRALEVVDRNAAAQAQLIDDMLDVARIMQGKLRLELQQTDLLQVVLSAVDVVRPAADAKGLSLSTDFEPLGAFVAGDAARLQQVIWNILSNAVKFTPRGGKITVQMLTRGSVVETSVTDTGKGISPDFLPYVFDRFRQEDSTTTRRYGGLGLGLSLVRQLVELHGGTVSVESPGESLGATFTVTLPLRSTIDREAADGWQEQPPEIPFWQLEGQCVLLVDDEDDARELLGAALTRHGARVRAVASARDAFNSLADESAERPTVLVADIGMPEEDGYALIRRIRELPAELGGAIPAIAVTGYAGPADRSRALAAGFNRHFSKPIDPVQLVQALVEVLKA